MRAHASFPVFTRARAHMVAHDARTWRFFSWCIVDASSLSDRPYGLRKRLENATMTIDTEIRFFSFFIETVSKKKLKSCFEIFLIPVLPQSARKVNAKRWRHCRIFFVRSFIRSSRRLVCSFTDNIARSISVTILLCIFMQRDVRKTQEMSHDQAPTRGKDVSRSEMSVKSLRVTIPLYARYSLLNLIERRFVSAPFEISAICSFFLPSLFLPNC